MENCIFSSVPIKKTTPNKGWATYCTHYKHESSLLASCEYQMNKLIRFTGSNHAVNNHAILKRCKHRNHSPSPFSYHECWLLSKAELWVGFIRIKPTTRLICIECGDPESETNIRDIIFNRNLMLTTINSLEMQTNCITTTVNANANAIENELVVAHCIEYCIICSNALAIMTWINTNKTTTTKLPDNVECGLRVNIWKNLYVWFLFAVFFSKCENTNWNLS